VGKASRKKGQRRQGVGQSRAEFELRRSFARLEANPSPALAAHVWGGGSKPEHAAIPKWPDDSAGDRFFSTQGIADAAGAPAIVGATLPTPEEMAATPELWVVATSALVRAVVLDGVTVNHPAVSTVIALLEPVVKRELAYYADETTWDEYPESDVPLRLLGDEVLMEATWAVVGDDSLASVLALVERRLDTAFDTPCRPASRQRAGWRRGRAGKRPRTRRAPMAAERGERARSSGWSRQPPDARAGVARPGS